MCVYFSLRKQTSSEAHGDKNDFRSRKMVVIVKGMKLTRQRLVIKYIHWALFFQWLFLVLFASLLIKFIKQFYLKVLQGNSFVSSLAFIYLWILKVEWFFKFFSALQFSEVSHT